MPKPVDRTAALAATVILLAFIIHNINAWYVEPQIFGFTNPAEDYADLDKLRVARVSWQWALSGFGHFVTGFAMVVLGVCLYERFSRICPRRAKITLLAAAIAAVGFLMRGISDITVRIVVDLLLAANPGHDEPVLISASALYGLVNTLAVVGLGWFMISLARCAAHGEAAGKAFRWFSYLVGLIGVAAVSGLPLYLTPFLIWLIWLNLILWQGGLVPKA